jgi:hypothetical protein
LVQRGLKLLSEKGMNAHQAADALADEAGGTTRLQKKDRLRKLIAAAAKKSG